MAPDSKMCLLKRQSTCFSLCYSHPPIVHLCDNKMVGQRFENGCDLPLHIPNPFISSCVLLGILCDGKVFSLPSS